MSPLTAKLKCPHGTGEDTHGAEAVSEVASDADGGGRQDHLKGGRGRDRCVLQAGQADWASNPGERDERVSSWQSGVALQPSKSTRGSGLQYCNLGNGFSFLFLSAQSTSVLDLICNRFAAELNVVTSPSVPSVSPPRSRKYFVCGYLPTNKTS